VVSASKSITRQYDDVVPDGDDKSGGKQSRSEKKSHKAMFKLGMKAILGVSRVTIKRTKYEMEKECLTGDGNKRIAKLAVVGGWVNKLKGCEFTVSLRCRGWGEVLAGKMEGMYSNFKLSRG
nr:nascent polypeptide-associated complex subunit alpha-like protein 2 [Tanacetum cinerariifolium]